MYENSVLSTCYFWSPDIEKQPVKPEPYKKYKPLYPICFARTSQKSLGRGWFWLYICDVCGKERVMSVSSILYSECQCSYIEKPKSYPIEHTSVCSYCNKQFTYTKKSKLHEVKYCSNTCRTEAKRIALKDFSERNKSTKFLDSFDRHAFCVRQPEKYYEICDHYHDCQTSRVMFGEFGKFYKEDNSCYCYSAINVI